MFSGLRLGSLVYILEKGDVPILKVAQVISATSPNTYSPYMNNTIDIIVKYEDKQSEFKQLPSLLSIANYNNGKTIVSESKDLMCNEVLSMIRMSEEILDSIPYHQNVIDAGEQMLKQLSPQYALLKDLEEKINNLENKVGSMESKLDNITSMLTKALNK